MSEQHILTPFKMVENLIYGAGYFDDGSLNVETLRKSSIAHFKPADPFYLSKINKKIVDLNSGIYLGHNFNMYGHFLLETLPMLSHVIDKKFSNIFFHNWDCRENSTLLKKFISLLELEKNFEDIFMIRDVCVRSSVYVPPRPIEIYSHLIDLNPYIRVIDCLKLKSDKYIEHFHEKVFLNSPLRDRVDEQYQNLMKDFFLANGFCIVDPMNLPIEKQIYIMGKARLVAGFEGSQLHNSIFLNEGASVIELASKRTQNTLNINQKMCGLISKSDNLLVPYIPDDISKVKKIILGFLA